MKRSCFYFPRLASMYIYIMVENSKHSNKRMERVQDTLEERGEKQFDRLRFTQGWLKFTLRTVERSPKLA